MYCTCISQLVITIISMYMSIRVVKVSGDQKHACTRNDKLRSVIMCNTPEATMQIHVHVSQFKHTATCTVMCVWVPKHAHKSCSPNNGFLKVHSHMLTIHQQSYNINSCYDYAYNSMNNLIHKADHFHYNFYVIALCFSMSINI